MIKHNVSTKKQQHIFKSVHKNLIKQSTQLHLYKKYKELTIF